jgi:hypothetical protein
MTEMPNIPDAAGDAANEVGLAYRVLRYIADLGRDEWINIGVLVFDDRTGERRVRLIESEDEFRRIRRLVPRPDEALLRNLPDHFASLFEVVREPGSGGRGINGGAAAVSGRAWLEQLAKWESTFSNALQLSVQKGVLGGDLDSELERLYAAHVAVPESTGRGLVAGSRLNLRSYCSQVFKQAHIWDRLDKSIRVSEFTFPGDPMRMDYSYRRNGTRGFVQTLSVTRSPANVKELAYTVKRIAERAPYGTEFAAVTDIALLPDNERHRFVREALRDAAVEAVPRDGFAVWVAKLRPLLLN